MTQSTLQEILKVGELPASLADRVHIAGDDPVLRTPFRIATAAGAALGAVGVVLAQLREMQNGIRSDVSINARNAGASMRSGRYILVNGKPARGSHQSLAGFYKAADGRTNYLHASFRWHEEVILRLLGVPGDRAKITEAVSRWNSYELEAAVNEAGGCAPVVRTPEEWSALPNTAAVSQEPLVEITQIGDCAPMPLARAGRPLSDIRVIDLTRVVAGPTCTRLLAEYGADVLKITCERYPDSASHETDTGYAKRKAILDLHVPNNRARVEELLRRCDVFCQSYRIDAMLRLGFSRERVAELRPGIVYTSLTAFGYTGPWAGWRGFDTVVQPASGMSVLQGGSLETPQTTPVTALDYLSGYLMAFGTLVALKRRAEIGGSYAVNVSLARVRDWLVGLGLVPADVVKATPKELNNDELAPMLTTVPSPLGELTRCRPIIEFSDGAFADLPPWPVFNVTQAAWKT